MELAVTVSTVGKPSASIRIYCVKDDYSSTKTNNFASNDGSLDNSRFASITTNRITVNIMIQWMMLNVFVSQKTMKTQWNVMIIFVSFSGCQKLFLPRKKK